MLIILCCIYFKSASPDGFKQDKPFVAKLALAVPICQSILLHSKNKNTFISIITWQAGCWFWNQICLKESNLKKKKHIIVNPIKDPGIINSDPESSKHLSSHSLL